jgi:hypothetical protein
MDKEKLRFLIICFLILAVNISANFSLEGNRGHIKVEANPQVIQEVVEQLGEKFIILSDDNAEMSGIVGQALLPTYTQLISLPNSGNYKIKNLSYEEEIIEIEHKLLPSGEAKDYDKEYYKKNIFNPQQIARVSSPSIMRGNRFSQIVINPIQYNPFQNKIKIYHDISFDLVFDDSDKTNEMGCRDNRTGKAFDNICKSTLWGWEDDRNLEIEPELYLFICPDSMIETLQPLVEWKRQLGFKTVVTSTSDIGGTNTSIKNYIQQAYDEWEIAPTYVVLVGDESGAISVPSFFITGYLSPNDVTDHEYTLLEGDDYFPDVMIGRLSCRSEMELATIVSKIISYEKEPITDINWFTRALMLSVIEEWGEYYSGRETVIAAGNKLLDFTYTVIDTFISPYQNSTSQLINMINQGATFINYRGFGSPYYWSGGYGNMMDISDISSLNNGTLLPMVTSIVCGGGDFAYNEYPTCFGEKWVNAGTPSNPKGAIAFIGPSEHDTKTQFNNTNDLGIYNGIAYEGIYGTSEMMLRGKMALYNSFPNCHEMDGINDALDSDKFYFFVYNLLGDPGLKIWTDNPKLMEIEGDLEIDETINNLTLNINSENPEGTLVALTSTDELISSAIADASGNVNLVFPYLSAGIYEITASKYGYIPEITNLQINSNSNIITESIELGECHNGNNVFANITLHNKSNDAIEDITISFDCDDEYIIFDSTPETFEIPAGGDYLLQTDFSIGNTWHNNEVFNLKINISYGTENYEYIHQILVKSPEFTFAEIELADQDFLECDADNEFKVEFTNTGTVSSDDVVVELLAISDNCEVTSNTANYSAISVGETSIGSNYFVVHINSDVIEGENISLTARISYENEVVSTCSFEIPVGDISQETPTYGDCGYYAIESTDNGNFDAPEYNWIEITPNEGGQGVEPEYVHTTPDGKAGWYDLPFEFIYFDQSYDAITVSTEGYLSMGKDELVFFRNRTIPDGVGPKAMIAPFWDNLRDGDIYAYYDSEQHYFIITWENFINSNYQSEEFQVILFDSAYYNSETENGMMLFQYKEINNSDSYDNFATIGIENHTQTDGLLLSYANIYPDTMHEIEDETAILITAGDFDQVDIDDNELAEHNYELRNYPNPIYLGQDKGTTKLCFNLPQNHSEETLSLGIYNIKGQRVWNKDITQADENYLIWDGTDNSGKKVSSGVYLYKLESNNKILGSNKLLLMK